MTIFTIEIIDETHLAGITAARTAYNNALQPMPDAEVANPELISTDDEYIQFVMSRAAESYAKQYGV